MSHQVPLFSDTSRQGTLIHQRARRGFYLGTGHSLKDVLIAASEAPWPVMGPDFLGYEGRGLAQSEEEIEV